MSVPACKTRNIYPSAKRGTKNVNIRKHSINGLDCFYCNLRDFAHTLINHVVTFCVPCVDENN